MKPFDLEKALAGEPVVTRDGRPVVIGGYNQHAKDTDRLIFWDANGEGRKADKDGKVGVIDQLFMAPTERKEWIVRGDFGRGAFLEGPFDSLDLALMRKEFYHDKGCEITIHEITISE